MIEPGLKNRKDDIVTPDKCADAVGSGLLRVYSTPSMIGLMEGCCHESVEPFLEDGAGTVGISLNVRHTAATPAGMPVYCESELVRVEGRFLYFEVKAFDSTGMIGEGSHERCIIDNDIFMQKVHLKMKGRQDS